MRISILTPTFLPRVGGAEVVVFELAKQLINYGHDVNIITPKWLKGPRWLRKEETNGIKIFRFNIKRRIWKFIDPFFHLPPLLKEMSPDILNAHYVSPTGFGGFFWSKIMRIPSVFTLHGEDIYDPIYSVPKVLQRLMKGVLRNCSDITAISSFVKNIVVSKFSISEERIKVIPNGVNTKKFTPYCNGTVIREKYHIKDNELLVLTVQRLHPRKAVQYFLKVISKISKSEDRMRFMIVGDGPEKLKLMKLSRMLKIEDKLIFTGFVPDSTLPSYYAACDIFTLHTLYEGLGVVLLEAIASGKPVVTTIAGGTTDIIQDGVNGLLVKPRDIEAFTNAVLILANNKDLRTKMGERGRKMAVDKFDWEKIAKKYIQVYTSVT